ncbi:MAG: AMP-binding protein [Deltaproteobacteria bacterium]|nr:AMP-binding protein [Deltaproteobacteria bacterium]
MNSLLYSVVWLLLLLRYRIKINGLNAIVERGCKGILFLPNHPALIDPVIVFFSLLRKFRPRSLADKDRISLPFIKQVALHFGAIPLPDPAVYKTTSKQDVARALDECSETLKRGENLLLYPAGRLSRSNNEDLGGKKAVKLILAKVPYCRIVLIRTSGLWGSRFSWGSGKPPNLIGTLLNGIGLLLVNFLFFMPKRQVTIELVEPDNFPRDSDKKHINNYLESFYNDNQQPNLYVPYKFWQRGDSYQLPEPQLSKTNITKEAAVPNTIREQIFTKINEISGQTPKTNEASLSRDLSFDSLARAEIIAWVEQEFGYSCTDPINLDSVNDLLLLAIGQSASVSAELKKISSAWYTKRTIKIALPQAENIASAFLKQAALDPNRLIIADQTSGTRSYRDLITAILVLRPHLAKLAGDYVAIMLPASVGAAVLYLATLFAGKIPVMVNWTTGARNIKHGLDMLGVQHVVTVSPLLTKLNEQGIDLDVVKDKFLLLDSMSKQISIAAKLKAALTARLSWRSLQQTTIADTAVVLFTSGSESLPKAVPLSHKNLLTNLSDIVDSIQFNSDDKIIGFLPPFHSFGLTGTVLLPLCTSIACVYFPNPTDGAALARIIAAYRATIMVGTPTFLAGVARYANDEQLNSLRMAVTGAEKCPDSLYETLAKRWPHLLVLEGYGITECSPVVSVNRECDPKRGSIGLPLPSIEHAIIDIEQHQPVTTGIDGMLLVRGPSIFTGYLNYNGSSPFIEYNGKQWYRTGDLVRADQSGSLFFVGRLKRFVKLGGEMVSLPAIEDVLISLVANDSSGEPLLAVVATADETNPELCLFTVAQLTRDQVNQSIRAAGLSALHNIRKVIPIEAIPVLGTGKVDYRALQAMLNKVS